MSRYLILVQFNYKILGFLEFLTVTTTQKQLPVVTKQSLVSLWQILNPDWLCSVWKYTRSRLTLSVWEPLSPDQPDPVCDVTWTENSSCLPAKQVSSLSNAKAGHNTSRSLAFSIAHFRWKSVTKQSFRYIFNRY